MRGRGESNANILYSRGRSTLSNLAVKEFEEKRVKKEKRDKLDERLAKAKKKLQREREKIEYYFAFATCLNYMQRLYRDSKDPEAFLMKWSVNKEYIQSIARNINSMQAARTISQKADKFLRDLNKHSHRTYHTTFNKLDYEERKWVLSGIATFYDNQGRKSYDQESKLLEEIKKLKKSKKELQSS